MCGIQYLPFIFPTVPTNSFPLPQLQLKPSNIPLPPVTTVQDSLISDTKHPSQPQPAKHLSSPSLGYPAALSNVYHLGPIPDPFQAAHDHSPGPILHRLRLGPQLYMVTCELGKSCTFLIMSFLKCNAQDKTISCGHC